MMYTSLKAYLAVCNEPDRSACVCLQSDENPTPGGGVSERDGESDSGNQVSVSCGTWAMRGMMAEFSTASPPQPPRTFWNSRKRSASSRSLENAFREEGRKTTFSDSWKETPSTPSNVKVMQEDKKVLSDRRRALFEPLQPVRGPMDLSNPAEELLPPPDFDSTSYPKGWLVGKKRKLVNIDVVESMRRIAIQEMNRKDREIDGLNEQLEEDARCLEHLQLQLLEERSKRADTERQNSMLQNQITMLMNMLDENQGMEGEDEEPVPRGAS